MKALIVLALVVAGCGSSTNAEYPALNGRARQRAVEGELVTVFERSLG